MAPQTAKAVIDRLVERGVLPRESKRATVLTVLGPADSDLSATAMARMVEIVTQR